MRFCIKHRGTLNASSASKRCLPVRDWHPTLPGLYPNMTIMVHPKEVPIFAPEDERALQALSPTLHHHHHPPAQSWGTQSDVVLRRVARRHPWQPGRLGWVRGG